LPPWITSIPTRLLVALGLVLLGLGVVGLAGCGGDDQGRSDIAFVSTRDGVYAIYAMGAAGEGQRRLTDAETDASRPEGLFFQVEPAWSPDGTQIAYSSRVEGTFDIYTMSADGSESRQLTATKEHDSHPTWGPDGQQIAFARDRDIYVMDADGSNAHLISDPLVEEEDPAWSPDGDWIAYVRRTPGTLVREVWLAHPNGTDRRQLTRLGGTIFGPAWSPDSKRIAFAAALEGSVYDIYTIGSGGAGLRRYTQSQEDAFEPSWSPDGTTIAFARSGSILTADLGGSLEELTDPEQNDSSPAWNPMPAAAD
jgi:TolB protein